MNIHEYQAKELIPEIRRRHRRRARSPTRRKKPRPPRREITGGTHLVVKAQIHAGGRGKGTFKNGFKGGVHLVKTPEEAAEEIAGKMLGQVLVTHQTGAGRAAG